MNTIEEKAKEFLVKNYKARRPLTFVQTNEISKIMIDFAQSLEETKQENGDVEIFKSNLEKERDLLLEKVNDHSKFMNKEEQHRLDEINYILFGSKTLLSNKKSVSDEEIIKEAKKLLFTNKIDFIRGAQWMREQLNK